MLILNIIIYIYNVDIEYNYTYIYIHIFILLYHVISCYIPVLYPCIVVGCWLQAPGRPVEPQWGKRHRPHGESGRSALVAVWPVGDLGVNFWSITENS